jgi:hypothetical protein
VRNYAFARISLDSFQGSFFVVSAVARRSSLVSTQPLVQTGEVSNYHSEECEDDSLLGC